jgi:hypothetical protein
VRTSIPELNARSRYQVFDRARDQQFIRIGCALYARRNVHRDAPDIVADQLTFASMQADANP